jgi:putative ABC transport system permease protein
MHNLIRNIRYSLRMLMKNSGLTLAIIFTLALGIGATTAIYTVVYATLLEPMPYANPDQLVMAWSKVNGHNNGMSAGDFLDWRRQSRSFQQLIAMHWTSLNLATKDAPEQVPHSLQCSPGYYTMLGYKFLMGRDLLPDEEQLGKDHEVVMNWKTWNRLGADPNIVGKSLSIDGEPYTVVGVLARGIGRKDADVSAALTVPLAFRPEQINHNYHWLITMGRLKTGVSMVQAQGDMAAVAASIAAAHPDSNKGWSATVEPLHNDFLPRERIQHLWLLLGAVGFVLLIACVNIANLLLAKGAARQREIAVRGALGATRSQIFGQFLTESLTLALVGGLLGILFGAGLLRVITMVMPRGTLPDEAVLQLDGPVLLVALAATSIAGLLFGCAPAWYATRVDPNDGLKDGGRAGSSSGSHQLRRALIVGELALALTLLAGAGLAVHSFWNLTQVDLGVRTDHVLTFRLNHPATRFKDPAQMAVYYRQMLDAVHSVAGVAESAAVTGMPLQYHSDGMDFTLVGGPTYADPSQRPSAGFQSVTPDFYKTFGIQIVQGRAFTSQDDAAGVRVAIVNEEFVRHYLKGLDPFKQRVSIAEIIPGQPKLGPPVQWQIVGISHSVRYGGFRDDSPAIDVPFAQSLAADATIGVRTQGDPAAMAKSLAAAVHTVDPQVALADIATMDQVKSDALIDDRFTMQLYAGFALVALLLAGVGIYGLMAFTVSQRTQEIGVRMALGASRANVARLIVRQGAILAFAGLLLGTGGAIAVGRAMQNTLYGVGALDGGVIAAVALVLFATALFASYLPARRAARIEPMQALRSE